MIQRRKFDKVQHLLIIKRKELSKIGIEVNFLNVIKSIYQKTTVNIILNGGRQDVLPYNHKQNVKMFALTILIQHSASSYSQHNKARKGNNRHTDWKGRH